MNYTIIFFFGLMSGMTVGLSQPGIRGSPICIALEERELEFYVKPNINKSLCNSKTHIPLAFRGRTRLSESGFYCRHLPEIKSPQVLLQTVESC